MANVYDINEIIEKESLLVLLMDEKYKRFYQYIIKKDISDLLTVKRLIADHPDEAEKSIDRWFKKWRIDTSGRDNWFAYDLSDKLVRAAGKEPKIMYEDE